MSRLPYTVKFDGIWVSPVRSKAKKITARYAPEIEWLPTHKPKTVQGAPIELVDDEDETFAMGKITEAWITDPVSFVDENYDGYPDTDLEEFLVRMNEYYKAPIHRRTKIVALEFDVDTIIGDYHE